MIQLANQEDTKEIIDKLQNFLRTTKTGHIVGERFLNEIYQGMDMITFINKDKEILAVSNAILTADHGISYHTIAFKSNKGIGSELFKYKIDYLQKNRNIILAKPETPAGLKMTLKLGFQKDTSYNNLLPWDGDSYYLK